MAHHGLCDSFTRKKPAEVWPLDSPLRRCLTVVDLTSLGVGTVVGAGLYVVTGELARDATGPAVVLSFLLASVAALLCVFSYAEYGCRVPKAGSAYVYTYITLGEIWAFIIGWTVVLEYIIAGASLARACSEYIDTLFQGEIYQFFMHNVATWNHPGLAPFPDFLAAAIVVVVVILLSYGVRISVNVQKAVTIGNIVVILFMIIYGLFFANFKNWTRKFASYDIHGVLQGAAGAFFAFSGFDVVTIAAEEAINPQRNIPLSLILVITISTLAYLGVTTILTLALSYKELEAFAPLAKAFAQVGNFPAAQYIIACGGICATFSSLVCVVFSSSRIVFSMSVDGLFFRWFAHVNDPTHSPIGATIITGCLTAVFALIFDIKQLVELLSIGTLLAYAMVTICVLVSRYETGVQSVDENGIMGTKARTRKWLESLSLTSDIFEDHSYAMATYQSITTRENTPNEDSGERVKAKAIPGSVCFYKVSVFCLVAGITGLVVVLSSAFDYIIKPEWWAVFLVCLFSGTAVVSLVSLQLQPQNNATFSFMVPGVPYIPAISIFINVLLMANLQWMTYARFGAWMAVGLIIYFLYGYHHSIEAIKPTSHSKGEFVLPEMPEFQGFVKKPQMRQ